MSGSTTTGTRSIGLLVGALMALFSGAVAAEDGGDADEVAVEVAPADEAADGEDVTEVLPTDEIDVAALVVEPAADGDDYVRKEFRHWIDADKNKCDTRQEVLILESLVPATVEAPCKVTEGEWHSLYDDLTVTDPAKIQIDHMVPLKEAWISGAREWSKADREAYANDLDEPFALIAVTGTTNQSKSDRDPGRWRPPDETSWCAYARSWITVKIKWELTADQDEVDALSDMLTSCT